MPDRDRKRVPDQSSDVLKGSFPRGPLAHPRNTNSRVSEADRRKREGEQRQINSEKYRGTVPETMWKRIRTILY